MRKILVVEDSLEVYSMVASALDALNLNIVAASSVKEATALLDQNNFELVILDLGLPDGDGLLILDQIRHHQDRQNTPVFILSSKSELAAKISAFSVGADDYITKPFHILELRARIESKLKRLSMEIANGGCLQVGPLVLEPNKLSVVVKTTNQQISLSPIEFRILALLARRPGQIFSREYILSQIWGQGVHVVDRTIDTHIYTLRKKMGLFGDWIRAVPSEGYRFVEEFKN